MHRTLKEAPAASLAYLSTSLPSLVALAFGGTLRSRWRCVHGSDPVSWDEDIAREAEVMPNLERTRMPRLSLEREKSRFMRCQKT